ncbi:MAG TPA: hypothetical protein VI110_16510 [Lapillicoccus sp.]
MRTLRRILLSTLAAGVLLGQGLVGASASAGASHSDQVKIVPSPRVYGETRGELMTEMWRYFYSLRIGDIDPECLSMGKNDKVLVGAHDSTCTIKHGRPQMWLWSTRCDTKSPPYPVTEADQIRCARDIMHPQVEYVKVAVDDLPPTTISTRRFEVISGQFTFVSPENNQFGYEPGPGTASADSWVAMVYLPVGHHVSRMMVKLVDSDEFTITKTVNVVR